MADATPALRPLRTVSELLQGVVDLETGVRGYALTADPSFLEPYESAQPHIAASLVSLRELVRDRPEQLARVDRVSAMVDDWQGAFAQPVLDGVRSGQNVQPFVRQGLGKRRIEVLRGPYSAIHGGGASV